MPIYDKMCAGINEVKPFPMNDNQTPGNQRTLMGCSAIFFVPLSAFILNEVIKAPPQNDPVVRILLVLLLDVAIASLLFFTAGLLWSIFKLDSLKQLLSFLAIKFAWTIIPFGILVLTLTAIAVIKG